MSKTRNALSDQPAALAARQREHRLRERIRPDRPVSENADPWLIGDQALDLVDRIRLRLQKLGLSVKELDQIEQRIKELCWGPED